LIDPIIELVNAANPQGGGVAVTIVCGNVYRGSALPRLAGPIIYWHFLAGLQPHAKIYTSGGATGGGMWPYSELKLKVTPIPGAIP